jgi:hypothetical protein
MNIIPYTELCSFDISNKYLSSDAHVQKIMGDSVVIIIISLFTGFSWYFSS